jgi:hypothetical protein
MSQTLQENLDYPSKLSRLPAHIDRLIANGEAQATAFLSELDGFGPPPANPLPNGDGAGPPRVPVDRPS